MVNPFLKRKNLRMWIGIVLAGVVLLLVAFAVLPRSPNPADGPLPKDVEMMLLLGEDPDAQEES